MYQPSDIILQSEPPYLEQMQLDHADFQLKSKASYLKKLKKWQNAILEVQQAYFHQNRRAILVFQGWDAAGKGGAIRRLSEKLDPRGYKVHPISAPTAEEQGRHYLYRFQQRLPIPGTISIFDRSWYERVLVERIEGFASEQQWQRAYQEINEWERMLTDDGVRIVKVFMHISKEEQLKRFTERLHNPAKHWKLTHEDIRNRDKWDDYVVATNDMFRHTSTVSNPWHIIPGNRKWFARIEVLKTVYHALAEGVDLAPPTLDESIVRAAEKELGISVPDQFM
ncbi:polyphosphate kinase [Maribrevibacterium harenarium]|uniref:Polyphosphate kinase n=1 Tax=Maribrevibacterium harenarium TaxID=2589817 RepID=A0A501WXF8_9GAMM|nr:PPK2 family polyphosphate kinase [Maribrevibacterium harenarium]TPE53402.1 polyphosphate kinase [Maribrevibacterium harenarium]